MTIDGTSKMAALVFVASAAVTIAWCGSMSGMPGMDMPGGWIMSMTWMRMPGQGWLEYAGLFLGMWAVMMVAMMTPALAPMLARYRQAMRAANKNALTATVAGGYFAVWITSGALLLPLGVAFAEWNMREPALAELVPTIGALTVVAAGMLQFSRWKARRLACCRHTLDGCRDTRPTHAAAWRHGVKLGLRCVYCCASLTAVLIVIGVMDLLAMALVTMAISAERLISGRMRPARVVGTVLIFTGMAMLVR
jgi:predicted metal-binding membrane protein